MGCDAGLEMQAGHELEAQLDTRAWMRGLERLDLGAGLERLDLDMQLGWAWRRTWMQAGLGFDRGLGRHGRADQTWAFDLTQAGFG